jgi:hypothetical protein
MDPLVDLYLSPESRRERDALRCSTLALCQSEARRISGRHGHTGQVIDEGLTQAWPGAMAYLSLLDQMGRAVRRTSLRTARRARCIHPYRANEMPFRAALVQFTDLDDDRISALYALRCAFSHFFGLVNVHSRPELTHRFVLFAKQRRLVQFPPQKWDGLTYPAHGGRHTKLGPVGTRVDLWTLGDTVERAVADLRARHARGQIERGQVGKLTTSDDEFRDRFTVRIWS